MEKNIYIFLREGGTVAVAAPNFDEAVKRSIELVPDGCFHQGRELLYTIDSEIANPSMGGMTPEVKTLFDVVSHALREWSSGAKYRSGGRSNQSHGSFL